MTERELIRRRIQLGFDEIQYLIRLLHAITDYNAQNLTLNQLWNQVSNLHFLVSLLEQEPTPTAAAPALPQPALQAAPAMGAAAARALPTFTPEQLATATGRNGNPAYIAVNGVVYDVTNNSAWSVASHFGLTAGRDLSPEFASCHAGQQRILATLRPVGRMA